MSVLSPTAQSSMTSKIRLAETPPTHCASCYAQDVEIAHVDFGAAYDGPTFHQEVAGGIQAVPVDDLVICERCLRDAVACLPRADDELLHGLEEENIGLRERLQAALRYIAKLEEASEAKEAFDPHRPKKAPPKRKG